MCLASPMEIHLVLDRAAPLRAQLERELREAIRSGRLRAGGKLPPSRLLADELDVSRGVVVEAYSQLVAEGYLVARPGDGTRIADGLAQQPPAARASPARGCRGFAMTCAAAFRTCRSFPAGSGSRRPRRALRELPDAAFTYGSRRGTAPAADRPQRLSGSRARGRRRSRADVHCRGGRARDVDPLAHPSPARRPASRRRRPDAGRRSARRSCRPGSRPSRSPSTSTGLDVAALEGVDVDAVVLSPAHQYPTGTVLAPARRAELIAWARRRGSLIVEDDYDAEYRYDRDPIASLQGLAPDCVVYVGTAEQDARAGTSPRVDPRPEPSRRGDGGPARSHPRDAERARRSRPTRPCSSAAISIATCGEPGAAITRAATRSSRRWPRDLPEASVGGASAGLHLIAWLPDGDRRGRDRRRGGRPRRRCPFAASGLLGHRDRFGRRRCFSATGWSSSRRSRAPCASWPTRPGTDDSALVHGSAARLALRRGPTRP